MSNSNNSVINNKSLYGKEVLKQLIEPDLTNRLTFTNIPRYSYVGMRKFVVLENVNLDAEDVQKIRMTKYLCYICKKPNMPTMHEQLI